MSQHGDYRADGSWIGFDYETQEWIDTHSDAERNSTCKPGSASNPLRYRNPCATAVPEVLSIVDPTGRLQRAGLLRVIA